MRRITLGAVLLMVALAWPALAQAPGPAQGTAPPGPGNGQRRMGPPDPARMVEMLAQRLGLSAQEKALTEKAVRAKIEAATDLTRGLTALRDVAGKEKVTDKELGAALKKYGTALAAYRQRTNAIDAKLKKSLSLKAQAGLTAAGVIDNGMGMRFGFGFGGGRMGQGDRRGNRGAGGGAPGPQATQ